MNQLRICRGLDVLVDTLIKDQDLHLGFDRIASHEPPISALDHRLRGSRDVSPVGSVNAADCWAADLHSKQQSALATGTRMLPRECRVHGSHFQRTFAVSIGCARLAKTESALGAG